MIQQFVQQRFSLVLDLHQGSELDTRGHRSAQVPSPEWLVLCAIYMDGGCASHDIAGTTAG